MFSQITIIAPGLLGASLAKVIKSKQLAHKVAVWARRPETRLACTQESWCDEVFETPEQAVKGSELIVLCPPVSVIQPLLEQITPHVKTGAIITDVGSTKKVICEAASKITNENFEFIGSHPMAGSDKSGLEFADENLFNERTCFLTPEKNTEETISKISNFWKATGMSVVITTPSEHDQIVTSVSHLPHLTAVSLCSLLAKQKNQQKNQWQQYSGPGLKDTTRVAGGSPDMWLDIIDQNKAPILEYLNLLKSEITSLEDHIKNDSRKEIETMLHRAREFRKSCN